MSNQKSTCKNCYASIEGTLFKTDTIQNVHINKAWNNALGENNNSTLQNEIYDNIDEIENKPEDEKPTEILIHGFTDSQRVHDLQDKILEIAPTEGQ